MMVSRWLLLDVVMNSIIVQVDEVSFFIKEKRVCCYSIQYQ
jgi:hypothetical protein